MSEFVPNKFHLRQVLLYAFNLKKSAAEAHRMIVEVYGEDSISAKTCREYFQRYIRGDFDIEDKECPEPVKKEDVELKALLDKDSSQTQQELADSLGVTQKAISNRLKILGMIQKHGYWVPYELKQRDVERRFFTCEQLLERLKRKSFLYRIVTGGKKWINYEMDPLYIADNNSKRKKSTAKRNIYGSKLMLCIWWDQLGVVYYELLQPGETITGAHYRTQLMHLSKALQEKRLQYKEKHDKVILLHDNTWPHVAQEVKTYLKTMKWDVLPHPPYSPDIVPSDYYLFQSMTHDLAEQHFCSYEEVKDWVDLWIASKDRQFFQRGINMLPEKWKKVVASDGQY